MKFAIITHVIHKRDQDHLYAYEPYVREMNLWFKNVTATRIVAPCLDAFPKAIESAYVAKELEIKPVKSFNLKSFKSLVLALFSWPRTMLKMYNAMVWADHIHVRCPGNMGLIACFVQMAFPKKLKTIKYAGNWDPKSKQPFTYRLQKWILSNTWLCRNAKVLVYGHWENQTKNIVPFFTATYTKAEMEIVKTRNFSAQIEFVFVGALVAGKRPMLSVQVLEELIASGINAKLEMFGDGSEKNRILDYIREHKLEAHVILHGNVHKEKIKNAFQEAHFNLFFSKSEGWPKAVAEGMFWGCLPITTDVSCVSDMLNNGTRGAIVNPEKAEICAAIKGYIENEEKFSIQSQNAIQWSRKYTMDHFEEEIKKVATV